MDESESVGMKDYDKEKQFLAAFVNEFNVGPNQTRFCLIEFGTEAVNRLNLAGTVSKDQVSKIIMVQRYDGFLAMTNIFG